jgi:uncharacterized protein YbjT (DUF2867 family)
MASILLFGATGLMGSHLVPALKKAYPSSTVTVYIRDTDSSLVSYLNQTAKVDKIVHGDFKELDRISNLAAEHEVVINAGSSWDVPLSQAIIAGLKTRADQGKSKPSLIHISGAGNFHDGRTDGRLSGDGKVWNVSFQIHITMGERRLT